MKHLFNENIGNSNDINSEKKKYEKSRAMSLRNRSQLICVILFSPTGRFILSAENTLVIIIIFLICGGYVEELGTLNFTRQNLNLTTDNGAVRYSFELRKELAYVLFRLCMTNPQ